MIPGAVHFRIVGYTENPPRTFSHGCLLFWESTKSENTDCFLLRAYQNEEV